MRFDVITDSRLTVFIRQNRITTVKVLKKFFLENYGEVMSNEELSYAKRRISLIRQRLWIADKRERQRNARYGKGDDPAQGGQDPATVRDSEGEDVQAVEDEEEMCLGEEESDEDCDYGLIPEKLCEQLEFISGVEVRVCTIYLYEQ